MRYFSSLPSILNADQYGNFNVLTNLLIRTELIPNLATNPLLFYQYSIQDGDTPESIANKYYGDPYRYWIVLYGNPHLLDAQSNWVMTSNQFTSYLQDKYKTVAGGVDNVLSYTQQTPYEYQKIITTYDDTTQTTAIKTIAIDQVTYNSLSTSTTKQTFGNGGTITYTISKNALSIYDYENQLNESKRNINLINNSYASDIELQYKNLVRL